MHWVTTGLRQGCDKGQDRLYIGLRQGCDRVATWLRQGCDKKLGYDSVATRMRHGCDRVATGARHGYDKGATRVATVVRQGLRRLCDKGCEPNFCPNGRWGTFDCKGQDRLCMGLRQGCDKDATWLRQGCDKKLGYDGCEPNVLSKW